MIFEVHSGTRELGNTAHLSLASMVLVAVPQMPRDMNPVIVLYACGNTTRIFKYYVFGHYPSSCLYLKCCPVYLFKT
jgi:hypothetical protein